jgi:glycosyltransferase involved in cell wall biosynthesis
MAPKISIVTPSYNQGQFIEESVKSVLAQNYNNFEHIIIDACSTDNTIEVLKKYPHLKWVSEPDEGQSDALNKGFKKATGDLILWLNADDIMMPNAFDKVVVEFCANTHWTVIHGNVHFFYDETGELFRNQYFAKFNHLNTVFRVVTPPSTGTFFNASYLKKNLLDINFHYMMDTEWYMRNGKSIKVCNLNDFLVKFRISKFNKTSTQITTGKLNKKQLEELNKVYNGYALPILKKYPKVIHKTMFKFYHMYFKTINRIKKVQFLIKKN